MKALRLKLIGVCLLVSATSIPVILLAYYTKTYYSLQNDLAQLDHTIVPNTLIQRDKARPFVKLHCSEPIRIFPDSCRPTGDRGVIMECHGRSGLKFIYYLRTDFCLYFQTTKFFSQPVGQCDMSMWEVVQTSPNDLDFSSPTENTRIAYRSSIKSIVLGEHRGIVKSLKRPDRIEFHSPEMVTIFTNTGWLVTVVLENTNSEKLTDTIDTSSCKSTLSRKEEVEAIQRIEKYRGSGFSITEL